MILTRALLLVVFVSSNLAYAGKILFVNMNKGLQEVEVAKKAAMRMNDELIIIPKDGKNFSKEEIKVVLEKNQIQRLIVSGHNGGGSYNGANGNFEIEDFFNFLETSPNKESITSVYLLGCYSGNKSKLFFWKNALPNLHFIAGYNGSAPLSSSVAGQNYLKETLLKEESIIKAKSKYDIQKILDNIQDIRKIEASILVSCGQEQYNYISMESLQNRLKPVNANDCAQSMQTYKTEFLPTVRKYWLGELEPTTEDTKTGFLRKAYAFARKNEECLADIREINKQFDPDSLLFLLFNKDFNQSFLTYYRPLIEKVLSQYQELKNDPSAYEKKFDDQKKSDFEFLKKVKENPTKYDGLINVELSSKKIEYDQFLADNPGLKDCVDKKQNCHFSKELLAIADDYNMDIYFMEHYKENLSDSRNLNFSVPDDLDGKIAILSKMLDHPDKITRSEMMKLSNSIGSRRLSPEFSTFESLLSQSDDLSPDFPFSWHEFLEKKEIATPKNTDFRVENAGLGTVKKIKDPEIRRLSSIIFTQVFDETLN